MYVLSIYTRTSVKSFHFYSTTLLSDIIYVHTYVLAYTFTRSKLFHIVGQYIKYITMSLLAIIIIQYFNIAKPS